MSTSNRGYFVGWVCFFVSTTLAWVLLIGSLSGSLLAVWGLVFGVTLSGVVGILTRVTDRDRRDESFSLDVIAARNKMIGQLEHDLHELRDAARPIVRGFQSATPKQGMQVPREQLEKLATALDGCLP
jgi:hypothetical protein